MHKSNIFSIVAQNHCWHSTSTVPANASRRRLRLGEICSVILSSFWGLINNVMSKENTICALFGSLLCVIPTALGKVIVHSGWQPSLAVRSFPLPNRGPRVISRISHAAVDSIIPLWLYSCHLSINCAKTNCFHISTRRASEPNQAIDTVIHAQLLSAIMKLSERSHEL